MSVLFYSLTLVFIPFLIHLSIWRIHLPRNQTKVLLQIFFGTLIIGILILGKFSATICEYLQLSFLFISLTLAYITTYSAVEADSPSLVMVMNITKAGPDGVDKDSFEQKMSDDILVVPRIRDLITGRLIYPNGEVCKLTKKGIFIARLFIAYRKLLKKSQKGG